MDDKFEVVYFRELTTEQKAFVCKKYASTMGIGGTAVDWGNSVKEKVNEKNPWVIVERTKKGNRVLGFMCATVADNTFTIDNMWAGTSKKHLQKTGKTVGQYLYDNAERYAKKMRLNFIAVPFTNSGDRALRRFRRQERVKVGQGARVKHKLK